MTKAQLAQLIGSIGIWIILLTLVYMAFTWHVLVGSLAVGMLLFIISLGTSEHE